MTVQQTTARISVVAEVANANAQIRKLSAQVSKLERTLERTNRASKKAGKGLEAGLDRASKSAAAMSKALGLAGIAGAAVGAYHALGQAAERSMQLDAAQRNLKFSITEARKSTMGMVTDFDLMQRANQAAALGVAKNSEEFAQLSEMAVKLGQNLGMTTDQAYESLIGSLGRGSSAMLDNLGVSLKASEAQAIYASRIGKTVSELDDSERKIAFQTIAYERLMVATRDVNIDTENAAAGFARLKTSIDNMIDEAYAIPQMFKEWGRTFEGFFLDMVGAKTPEAIETAQLGLEQFFDYASMGVKALTLDFEGLVAAAGSFDKTVRAIANQRIRDFKQTDQYKAEMARRAAFEQFQGYVGQGAEFIAGAMDKGAVLNAEQEAKKRKGGRGGRGRDPAAGNQGQGAELPVDLFEGRQAQRAALASAEADALERAAEAEQVRMAMAAQGATELEQMWGRVAALDAEKAANDQIYAARVEAAKFAGDQSEVRQLEHEAEIYRLENQAAREQELAALRAHNAAEEKKRLEAQRAAYIAWGQTTGGVVSGFAATYQMAAEQAGVSDEKRQKAAMRMGGIVSLTEATVAAVKAGVAFASGNIPQGVALAAAATFATAQGLMLLSGRVPGGAGSAGGAGGAASPANPDRFGSRDAPDSRVPGSPTADNRPRPTGTSQGSGGGNTVVVNLSPGVMVGNVDQETAEKLNAVVKRGATGSYNV